MPVFLSGNRLAYLSGDVFDSAEYPALKISDLDGEASATVVPKNHLAWGDAVLADLRMPGGPCGPLLSPDMAHLITNVSRPRFSRLDRGGPAQRRRSRDRDSRMGKATTAP